MSEPRPTDRRLWLAVALLLAAHTALAFAAVRTKSVTYDEIYHVTGGYLFDRFNEFRVHTDNGVLPQRLHGLAPLLAGAAPPRMDDVYWRTSDAGVVAHHFFYGAGNDHWPWLLGARALNLLFGIGTCLFVFLATRQLAGDRAALAALALATFSPTLLAHGPLATTDAAAALLLPASATLFWRQLERRDARALGASAVVFGLACVTKYSALILLPVFVALAVVHALARSERRWAWLFSGLLAHAAAAALVIWCCFAFRFAAMAPDLPPADHLIRPWPALLERLGWQAPIIDFARAWHLLPEGFLYGYANTAVGAQARATFLAGEYGTTGWWQFFPLAFLWKSTPAELVGITLALVALVAAALSSRQWRSAAVWAPLVLFAAAYGVTALTSRLNIGHRHLLPLYPVLWIAAGVAATQLPRLARLAPIALAGTQALSATLAFPDYLAYFNRASGRPEDAWHKLVDSSLDWGQDLPALRDWLRDHNAGPDAAPVFLSYFGSGDPAYYGVRATRLPFVNGFKFQHPRYELRPGIYCISATMLQLVYSPYARWSPAHEHAYTTFAARAATLTAAEWEQFDQLRFARLCHHLRQRSPDARAGSSILIYRVDAADLQQATASR